MRVSKKTLVLPVMVFVGLALGTVPLIGLTLFTVSLLVVYGMIANFLMVIVLNVVGVPGALLAGQPGKRSKGRFITGSIVSAIGQSYVYLAYTAFIVSWAAGAASRDDVLGFIVWPFAFLAVVLPFWMNLIRARLEAREMEHASAQTEALHLTFLVALSGFFVFVFMPTVMEALWGWVPYTSR